MDNLTHNIQQKLEQNFVKSTYDTIAEDFSSTRYKKWPKVDLFLKSLPPDSLLLDVGCGNGKYLDNLVTYNIGCDISRSLLSICKSKGFEVVQCDMTRLPFRVSSFDALICIASLHHIASDSRRKKCVEDMITLLDETEAKSLIQVWSFEQDLAKNNPYLKHKGLTKETLKEDFQVREEVKIDDKVSLPVHINRTQFTDQDLLVPFNTKQSSSQSGENPAGRHLRYYHVFKQNELDGLIQTIENVKIESSYYDKGNWCVILSRNK